VTSQQMPAPATVPAVNFTITKRGNGWVTAVGSDGRTVTVSVGGNGR